MLPSVINKLLCDVPQRQKIPGKLLNLQKQKAVLTHRPPLTHVKPVDTSDKYKKFSYTYMEKSVLFI